MTKLERLEKELIKDNSKKKRKCVPRIYPSNLTNMCPRFFCLLLDNECWEKEQFMNVGIAMTFEIGNAMQTIIENKLKDIITGTEIALTYEFTDKLKLSGRIDILFNDGEIWEVKSIKAETFDALTEPQLNHVYQLKSYLWAVSKSTPTGLMNSDRGSILYMSKGASKNPFKLYEVVLDQEFIDMMDSLESAFKSHEATGELPEKKCVTKFYPLAKQCPLVKVCLEDKLIDVVGALYD